MLPRPNCVALLQLRLEHVNHVKQWTPPCNAVRVFLLSVSIQTFDGMLIALAIRLCL